jgi:hypothetical protein
MQCIWSIVISYLILGTLLAIAVFAQVATVAQGKLNPFEQFDSKITLQTKDGQFRELHVVVSNWGIPAGISQFPQKGFIVVQLRAGTLTTMIDNDRQHRNQDGFWTVPAGSSMSFEIGSDSQRRAGALQEAAIIQTMVATDATIQSDNQCKTICFRSPQFYMRNSISLLPGVGIEIGGVNYNVPTRDLTAIKLALQGGRSPLQRLNQQFVAAQLSLNRAGGLNSPQVFSAFQSPLSCYGFNFAPITLSHGFVLTTNSTLVDLFEEARLDIRNNLTADMLVVANILASLNGNDPQGRCGR